MTNKTQLDLILYQLLFKTRNYLFDLTYHKQYAIECFFNLTNFFNMLNYIF